MDARDRADIYGPDPRACNAASGRDVGSPVQYALQHEAPPAPLAIPFAPPEV